MTPGEYGKEAKAIVSEMTLEEKVHMYTGQDYWGTYPLPRFGITRCVMSDGPHGVRRVKEKDHLGQSVNERATAFPVSAALGATWNKDLLFEVGQALGLECQSIGVDLLLGPGVNMKRSVLGGRNFEYLSEDPVLAGKLAASIVKGVQKMGAGACVKHFACNNSEHMRMTVEEQIDERTLRELYLRVFEIIIKEAQPLAVMGAYNKVNGHYACENKKLLTDILRSEWGFEGIVISDWLAVEDCVKAVDAGLNLEMPGNRLVYQELAGAVKQGDLKEEVLDERLVQLIAVILKLQNERKRGISIPWEKHSQLAQEAAAQGIVLLKNEGRLMPFQPEQIKTMAVIGDMAVHMRTQGGGSSKVEAQKQENVLEALKRLAGDSLSVRYAKGYVVDQDGGNQAGASRNGANQEGASRDRANQEGVSRNGANQAGASQDRGNQEGVSQDRGNQDEAGMKEEALRLAGCCDAVVIFAGLPDSCESEGYDRTTIQMPENQVRLIQEIAKARRDILVVLCNGSAVELPFAEQVDGILETWLLGQEAAEVIAKVLLGMAVPSGRLAETFPERLLDDPAGYSFLPDEGTLFYGERMMIGYRSYEMKGIRPAFPFGHGLSYTEFAYYDLRVSKEAMTDKESIEVSVAVKNTGAADSFEVVQLYVSNRQSARLHPKKELKDFAKVYIRRGEEKRVRFNLDKEAFQCYSSKWKRWMVEEGRYLIGVGTSSADIRLKKEVTVREAHPFVPELSMSSTLEEWLRHPKGAPLAEEMLSHYQGFGMGEGTAFNSLPPFVQRIMLEMPMPRLIAASSESFTKEQLYSMLAKLGKGNEVAK